MRLSFSYCTFSAHVEALLLHVVFLLNLAREFRDFDQRCGRDLIESTVCRFDNLVSTSVPRCKAEFGKKRTNPNAFGQKDAKSTPAIPTDLMVVKYCDGRDASWQLTGRYVGRAPVS